MWRPVVAGVVLVVGVQAMWAGQAWLTLPAVAVVWGLMLEMWRDRADGAESHRGSGPVPPLD